jgi:cytochrome c oxidase subunit II
MIPRTMTQGPKNKGREPARSRPGDNGRQPVRGRPRSALQLALLVGVLLITSGCGIVNAGISGKAREVHGLYYIILWLALPVFLFVWGMLGIGVVRFRRKRGDESEPVQTTGHPVAITAFFAGPLAIIIALLGTGEVTVNRVDHLDAQPAEQLVVTGSQWQWSARYVKEGVSVSGKTASESSPGKPLTMALPAGRSVRVTLQSQDVIHGFFVPGMLFMKNAVPGHPNVFAFTPTNPGTYRGQCTQFCGLWHSRMTLVLKVLPVPQFQAWVKQQQQAQAKAGSCTPSGSSITLTAQHISWDKSCIAAVPGKPIQVTIINKDAGIAHNFAIWVNSSLKRRLYQTPNVTGTATKTFTAPALKPGKYYFQCDVHGPAMSGTLVVGNPGG